MLKPDRVEMPTAVLMLSHCVPQPTGGHAREEAWRLLTAASAHHRVYLACVRDGPVNLGQWRLVRKHAERIALESPPMLTRALRRFGSDPGVHTTKQSLLLVTRHWVSELPLRAAICTDASLETLVERDLPIWDAGRFATPVMSKNLHLPEAGFPVEVAKAA